MNSDCTPISISDILTDDLITEVLVRLPVKSLLRCKSVSEPWLSLISNPNFIISHVKHTREAAQALIFCTHERSISLLHIDSCEIGDPLGDFSFVCPFVKPIGCFFFFFLKSLLVVVMALFVCGVNRILLKLIIFIFGILQLNRLNSFPHLPFTSIIFHLCIGFNSDPIGNDHKVVVILYPVDKPRTAQVYSANTNVW